MTANIGKADFIVRFVLGVCLFILPLLNIPAIWSSAVLAYGSIAIGLILVATAFLRFCPLYRILGISTCKI